MKVLVFDSDGAAVAGVGVERNSGETAIHMPRGCRIMRLIQPLGVLANDADWGLWVDYKDTGQLYIAEELDPINGGGVKLGPSGIRIHPGAIVSFHWAGQAAARVSSLSVHYED